MATPGGRRRRADGEQSRLRIIEAAIEIAGERGYDGTSIAAVSERSGLPPSSIYWHFADKDALVAAVIEHSYGRWLEHLRTARERVDGRADPLAAAVAASRRIGRALAAAPDFLRLGLMLTLERRPRELAARRLFLDVRRRSLDDAVAHYRRVHGAELTPGDARHLAMVGMALADGLFVAGEVEGEDLPADRLHELAGVAMHAVARHLVAERAGRRRRPRPTPSSEAIPR